MRQQLTRDPIGGSAVSLRSHLEKEGTGVVDLGACVGRTHHTQTGHRIPFVVTIKPSGYTEALVPVKVDCRHITI